MRRFYDRTLLALLALFILNSELVAQARYSIVMDELMADPSPPVGLPNSEWIELKNTGNTAVDLRGFRIADLAGQSGPMPSFLLQPDSFVVICGTSAQPGLAVFGVALGVSSFPSLDNDGETLRLLTAGGAVMHALAYETSWYRNALKKEGGWTLEMIEPLKGCQAMMNWSASIASDGGTPGRMNSVDGLTGGLAGPVLLHAYAPANNSVSNPGNYPGNYPLTYHIDLYFDQSLDSADAVNPVSYEVQGIGITAAEALPPLFNQVRLILHDSLEAGRIYHVHAQDVTGCTGEPLAAPGLARVGLPVDALPHELVITEILFNPVGAVPDFVEFFHTGSHVLNVADLSIANRDAAGEINDISPMRLAPFLVFPGDYYALTVDTMALAKAYRLIDDMAVHPITAMPSFPDDEGSVLLLDRQGNILDEVHYHKQWHFPLISDPTGVSLERIDPDGPSMSGSNWTSASTTSGYATPGYVNSQFRQPGPSMGSVSIGTRVFTPDRDGLDDMAIIHWALPAPGSVASVRIFDRMGNPVRRLVNNALLSSTGQWTWDGLNDRGQPLPQGHYILLTEIFDLSGKLQRFKNLLVLARR